MVLEDITQYCKDRQVPEETQSYLRCLPSDDLQAILLLITKLSPSSNSLRSIIDLLRDISHRDRLSFENIFEKINLEDIISIKSSSKDKLVKLKNVLERIRYPEKFKLEDDLNSLVETIRSNFGFKILLPEELEGDQLQIFLNFKSSNNLSLLSKKLEDLSKSDELIHLFAVLKGEV